MSGKEIPDQDPTDTDGFWIVILSFVEEWLRVTVVRTRINEYFAWPFRLSHGEEKTLGRLRGSGVFAAGNYQAPDSANSRVFLCRFCQSRTHKP